MKAEELTSHDDAQMGHPRSAEAGASSPGPAPVPTGHDVPRTVSVLVFLRDRGIFMLWGLLIAGLRVLVLAVLLHRRQRAADRQRRRPHRAVRGRRRHRHHDRRPRPVAAGHRGDRRAASAAGCSPTATPPGSALLAGLACGVVVGLVNGLITLRGFNPIIVTIGTLSVLTGLAAVVAGGYTFPGLTQLEFMGTHRYLGSARPATPSPASRRRSSSWPRSSSSARSS